MNRIINFNEYYDIIIRFDKKILTLLIDGTKYEFEFEENINESSKKIIIGKGFDGVISDINIYRDKICEFIPEGKTVQDCVLKCKNMNTNCSSNFCNYICETCDSNKCLWNQIENKNMMDDNIISKNINNTPIINVKTFKGKAEIFWNNPYNKDINVKAYVIFIYKTFKKKEGVKLNLATFPNCNYCNHIIMNLDEKESYTVYVRAYIENNGNEILSDKSNEVTFIPKFRIVNSDYQPNIYKHKELENYNYCN